MKITKAQLKQIIKKELNEVYSEKQRRWACAQKGDDFKGERSLSKKEAEEMCKGPMKKEVQIIEDGDDRCTRIAKSKYDVWPSAYASGAVVRCRKGDIWKDLKEEEITDAEEEELKKIKKELEGASKMHKGQAGRVGKIVGEGKKNCGCGQTPCITHGIQEKKQSSEDAGRLDKWFGRKGEKGSKGGWVDCNAPDGDGGYKECAQGDRKKKPYCRPTPSACKKEPQTESVSKQRLMEIINEELEEAYNVMMTEDETYYEVDAVDMNEEYCPVCVQMEEEKKPCKPSKGKRFAKRVDGKCRSYGQSGQAKSGGDRIRPGTKKGDAYCARSAGIKKCKNPPCANTLSRKKWKCRGKKSMKS